ncbi:MAG: nodulation protein NfeD [Candidatus Omnitrophica bacterium]|nr:nodulation protein NfeD [Candidatus Omnitrophota bacterium]
MKLFKNFKLFLYSTLTLTLFLVSYPNIASAQNPKFYSIQLDDDTINPVTAEYIIDAISLAEKNYARGLILKLDTPGGLLSSTRLIVKRMLTAEVPILVYISPSGSRAGSAGVFITYASHLAAMAPSTNIGAAHPVKMGGGAPKQTRDWDELRQLIDDLKSKTQEQVEPEKDLNGESSNHEVKQKSITTDENPMESKILNDTVAFIKAIAKERNRNIEWAIKSVTESDSITDQEALEKGVIEIIAKDDDDLLEQINGRVIQLQEQEYIFDTQGAVIENIAMTPRQQFFNILANPNIAYFLMILGFYGLLYEITHPGIGFPGIMGVIFLVLAFYSMQTLPTNYAGLALVVLGLILLIAEAYVPGFGLLTLGGLVCLVLGSLLLFDTVDPIMKVSIGAIATFSVTTILISVFVIGAALKIRRSQVQSGVEGLIGKTAEVQQAIAAGKKGKVYVHGEIWNATADQNFVKGEEVIVDEVSGLSLKVRKKV